MKKLLSLLLAVMLLATLVACSNKEESESDLDEYRQNEVVIDNITINGDTFYFDAIDSETITITNFKGSDVPHKVTIPEKLNEKTVVSISADAFYSYSNITEIVIPATVTFIGDRAFACCNALKTVVIPASVTSIGDSLFLKCSSLTSVTFGTGSKIDAIPANTFSQCTSLETITVPAHIKTVGVGAFRACTALKTLVVSEGVEIIEKQAFQDCAALESVTLPASVTSIGEFNFNGAPVLYIENVVAPKDSAAAKYIESLNLSNKPAETTPAA